MILAAAALALCPPAASPSLQVEQELLQEVVVTSGPLSLESHCVHVLLNNGFSQTTITQVLRNPFEHDLEATYSFPLPEAASLSALSITVDGVRSLGEVTEKAEARQSYEKERDLGEDAALVEQNGCFEFQVSIARVPAQAEVLAEVVYYQPLEIDQGVGTYVYPLTPGNTDDRSMDRSFWNLEPVVKGEFSIDVELKTSFPMSGLHSPSHSSLQVTTDSESSWSARYSETGGAVLQRDFVLHYRLDETVPARIELLTHRTAGQAEGTFMAVITPGADLEPIRGGTDWFFVLDVSGSMEGEKLRAMIRGVDQAVATLGARDRFQLLTFTDRVQTLTEGWTAPTTREADAAQAKLKKLRAGGSTNIFSALHEAYRELDTDRSSAILLISDGVSNAGPAEYRDFIQLAEKHDARLFTFVMGNGSNRILLNDLAALSGGFAEAVSVQEEIAAKLMLARDRMSHEALHGIRFDLDGATEIHPRRLPSLYLGEQLVIFGKYQNSGTAQMRIHAQVSGEERVWTMETELPAIDESNPEIERLYALSAIRDLERDAWLGKRESKETRQGIVELAKSYSLVTEYTSMVVVSEGRKSAYGLGSANATRRERENRAKDVRARAGNHVSLASGQQPLAGPKAAHAPARARARSQSRGSSGPSGTGAVGPLEVLGAIALIALLRATRCT